MSIQSCTHSGSTDSKIVEAAEHLLQPLDVALQKAGPPPKLLPESKRHSILQVGAADFNHVVEFLSLGGDRVMNALNGRNQCILHSLRRRNVHRGRKRVVRRLRHVELVIGMDWL